MPYDCFGINMLYKNVLLQDPKFRILILRQVIIRRYKPCTLNQEMWFEAFLKARILHRTKEFLMMALKEWERVVFLSEIKELPCHTILPLEIFQIQPAVDYGHLRRRGFGYDTSNNQHQPTSPPSHLDQLFNTPWASIFTLILNLIWMKLKYTSLPWINVSAIQADLFNISVE